MTHHVRYTLHAKMAMSDSQWYPLKFFSDQIWINHQCLLIWKLIIFGCGFSTQGTCAFLLSTGKNCQNQTLLYLNLEKRQYHLHCG